MHARKRDTKRMTESIGKGDANAQTHETPRTRDRCDAVHIMKRLACAGEESLESRKYVTFRCTTLENSRCKTPIISDERHHLDMAGKIEK